MRLLAGITAVSGCAVSGKPIATEKVSSVYSGMRLNWRGQNSYVAFQYTIKNHEGNVAVCGAYRESESGNGPETTFTDAVAEDGIIKVNGKKVLHNVRFFAAYGPTKSLYGKSANCVVTTTPWLSTYSRKSATMTFAKTSYVE
jgi:hypothetical protein